MAHINARLGDRPSSQEVSALVGLFTTGRYLDTATVAEAMTRRFPGDSLGWKVWGAALRQLGRNADALAPMQQAVELAPGDAEAHNNLGAILRDLSCLIEAADCSRKALTIRPDFVEAYCNLGGALKEIGRLDEATTSYRRALEINPGYAMAHSNLGNTLTELGRLDEAMASCRRALEINPAYAEAHTNLGVVLNGFRRLDEAVASCRRALQLKPDNAEAHNNLSAALLDLERLDEAEVSNRRALELKPSYAVAHCNRANCLKDLGRLDEAVASYRRTLEIKPDYVEAHSNLILALLCRSGNDEAAIAAELRQWNEHHGAPLARFILPHPNDRSPERRLRIGYVSPDFRSQPVGRFLLPLLAAHDRRSFEIFCYSTVRQADGLTAQLRAHAAGWRELAGRTDRQAADLIRTDRIDILVDLALHTAGNRLAVFALKPAPVQVTYLAYPGNSGLDTIDYRITDIYFDPPGRSTPRTAEQPLRLPETYWCYQPVIQPAPAVDLLPALRAGAVTFGCLNNFCKVTPSVLEAWTRILVATPGASLVLHAQPGAHRLRVQEMFATHGIDPQRLRFVARVSLEAYFRLYQSIDIALDPFPFPGGTTTCDALWMGVPVVSLTGATAITRAGLSLLSNVGLPEFVVYSVDDYVAKAIAVARDLPRLAMLRSGLRDRMQRSPLMDASRFTRNLEAAYRSAWGEWCDRPDANRSAASPSG